MPSRGSALATAVARMTLSPMRTTAEPCACLASLPVSNVSFLPPERSTLIDVGSGFMFNPFLCRRHRETRKGSPWEKATFRRVVELDWKTHCHRAFWFRNRRPHDGEWKGQEVTRLSL